MFIPPVIERELRAALHRRNGTKSRSRVAKIGVAIVVFFLLVSTLIPWAGWGQNLHRWFFYWGLYLAITPPIRISVGLFSEERRNRTLELLYLTGVTSGELFLGKLFGGMLVASADLLALAPLLTLPFLIGGISLDLYFATIACLPALFLFCIATGVLASVLFKDEGAAFIFMIFLAVGVNLAVPIPFYLGRVLSGAAPFSAKWLCLSPVYAPYLVIGNFGGTGPALFWRTILAIIAWSGLCLIAAVWYLNRNWREDVQGGVLSAWRSPWKAWLYGAPSWRADLKAALLPANPFQWLIQQDRRPALAGYAAIGFVCAVWLLGWRAWPQSWPSNPNFFLTAMVLIVLVNWLTMYAAARRMGTDRRDGIFELVLTTPASPEEIVDGEVRGLEAQFKPLRITVFCLLMLMMAMGFHMRSWNARAAITYLLIWCVLGVWCLRSPKGAVLRVAWAALNSGQTAYSVFKWRGNKWTWIWLLYNFRGLASAGFGSGSFTFPSGSTTEFMWVCVLGIPAVAIYGFGLTIQRELQSDMRRRMIMDMRLIATEPLPDPHDPAFKNWDGIHRLRHRVSKFEFGDGWPVFADPVEPQRLQAYLDSRSHREMSNGKVSAPQDVLALFRALDERRVNYSVAGRLAMNAYFGNREVNDIDVLVSNRALKLIPDVHIEGQTNFFAGAQYRQIRVVAYLTENPFFEEVRAEFQTKVPVAGVQVAVATVEGLIALNLYAVHCLNRQRQYYRIEAYEVNIIALLTLCEPAALERVVTLMRAYIPAEHQEELEDTLKTCRKEAARWHKQPIFNKVLKALGALS
jgi:hypothetical protein